MLSLKQCLKDIANFIKISDNNLQIGKVLVQWGTSSKTIAAKDGDSNVIVFLKNYTATPVVFTQSTVGTNFSGLWVCGVKNITTTQFDMTFHNQYTAQQVITGNWIAIGKA